MQINYANSKVKKYFDDYSKLQKKLNADWVRSIKKHLNNLRAADTFGDFLSLGLGRPELLEGYKRPRYSIRVSANVRLIVELDTTQDDVMECQEIEVEGVCDYHGEKEEWYIP